MPTLHPQVNGTRFGTEWRQFAMLARALGAAWSICLWLLPVCVSLAEGAVTRQTDHAVGRKWRQARFLKARFTFLSIIVYYLTSDYDAKMTASTIGHSRVISLPTTMHEHDRSSRPNISGSLAASPTSWTWKSTHAEVYLPVIFFLCQGRKLELWQVI